jgi:anthranilate phosphoribosyltransferase
MSLIKALNQLIAHQDLSAAEAEAAMREIMAGTATPVQIGAYLIALRMKGETVTEIAASARVMRALAEPVLLPREHLVDIVGTGGDGASTFNVSTAASFVAAAAGARVAKHGNRSVSSKSGSADVLEAAGVQLDLTPAQVAHCVQTLGIGFMFAPRHHGAMKHAVLPRRELGLRTMFNLLGPLTNPAQAPCQVLGVFDRCWLRPLAEVMCELGSEHVLVVHAEDGLDEFSIAAATQVAELHNGTITEYRIDPRDLGFALGSLDALRVQNADESLRLLRAALSGTPGPARDIVAINAAAALYVCGRAASLAEGVALAIAVMASGQAEQRLEAFIALTQSLADSAATTTAAPASR